MDGGGAGSDDRVVKKFKPTIPAVRGRGAGPVKPSGRGRPLPTPATATKEATLVGKQSQGLGRGLMGQAARAAANSSKGAARAEAGLAGPAGWSGAAATGMGTEADDGFAGTFARELPAMMYGFGDDEAPLQETVEVVEAALLQYLGSVAHRAAGVAATSLKPKPDDRDVLFVVRKDPVKFARIKELLMMDHLIKDVRSLKSDMDELKLVGSIQDTSFVEEIEAEMQVMAAFQQLPC